MIPRPFGVGVVVASLLAIGSVCSAAEPDSSYAPGMGGIAGMIGASQFAADADYSEGAQPRLGFAANFRYVVNPWLRWQLSPGFTWAAYGNDVAAPFRDLNFPADSTKDEYLSLLLPASAQAQVVLRRGRWAYHVGAGPGLYKVWVQNRRKVLKDPTTFTLHSGIYPGVSAEIGAERFLKVIRRLSVEASLAGHLVFADRPEKFPRGFSSNVLAVEARVGANYYFDLTRRSESRASPIAEPAP